MENKFDDDAHLRTCQFLHCNTTYGLIYDDDFDKISKSPNLLSLYNEVKKVQKLQKAKPQPIKLEGEYALRSNYRQRGGGAKSITFCRKHYIMWYNIYLIFKNLELVKADDITLWIYKGKRSKYYRFTLRKLINDLYHSKGVHKNPQIKWTSEKVKDQMKDFMKKYNNFKLHDQLDNPNNPYHIATMLKYIIDAREITQRCLKPNEGSKGHASRLKRLQIVYAIFNGLTTKKLQI